ncbi:type IV secretion system protein [Paraburkholderia tropica]|uniref:type IV secretion system protein n=1 Tax=Paraburkholderia tropica TaxID=92647 RepID=UPI002AB6DD6A|nr:type IV secretion system protein [Paraburkholderia tropica]
MTTIANTIEYANSMFSAIQSSAKSLSGTYISEGETIAYDLGLFMETWFVILFLLGSGLSELWVKTLGMLIRLGIVLFMLTNWTGTTYTFFVTNTQTAANKITGTTLSITSMMNQLSTTVVDVFSATRTKAAEACETTTSSSGTESQSCPDTSSVTGALKSIWTYIKNSPLIFVTLMLKCLCILMLIAMMALIAAFVQIGSVLLGVAFVIGPLLVPWLVMPFTEFLFTGWLKFTIAAGLYRIVAVILITMFQSSLTTQIKNALATVVSSTGTVSDDYFSSQYAAYVAITVLGTIVCYLLFQIPRIANGLVSGGTGNGGEGFIGAALKSSVNIGRAASKVASSNKSGRG